MIAVDTSVVVAAFASWHEAHAESRQAMPEGARLPAPVAAESYSVLTRLPPPHRAPPEVVASFLTARFPDPPLVLQARALRSLVAGAPRLGIAGGAIYVAVIGATAAGAGATLLTRDRRAGVTYRLVGASFELLE